MNTPLNKNLMKKFFSLAGVATASVALSLPAFALTHTEASSSNQRLNSQTLAQDSRSIGDPSNDDITTPANLRQNDRTSSTEQTIESAQSDGMNQGDRMNQGGSEDGMNQGDRMNQPASGSTTGGINNTEPSSTRRNLYGTSDMNNNNDNERTRRLLTGGDSVTGTIFRCVNNPNPNCG